MSAVPAAPTEPKLSPNDPRTKLVENVRSALRALPFYFHSDTEITGLEAQDLFALNTVLGSTIETQTVATLNRIRDVWDPDDEWTDYGFRRYSQSFPDVRLVRTTDIAATPILGIELKGWYLLAKEKEPTFRYKATAAASTEYDLLAVVPWHLADVLSGQPVVLEPLVVGSQYAAAARNYYWQHGRGATGNTEIEIPEGVMPYGGPKAQVSDRALDDAGGNFGRLARSFGFMEDWTESALQQPIAGIAASHWVAFFKKFTDASDPQRLAVQIDKLLNPSRRSADQKAADLLKAEALLTAVQELTRVAAESGVAVASSESE